MQTQARRVHLIDVLRRIQDTKNPAQPRRVLGNDSGFGARFKEDAQPGVAKACDHSKSVICCLTDYKFNLWVRAVEILRLLGEYKIQDATLRLARDPVPC